MVEGRKLNFTNDATLSHAPGTKVCLTNNLNREINNHICKGKKNSDFIRLCEGNFKMQNGKKKILMYACCKKCGQIFLKSDYKIDTLYYCVEYHLKGLTNNQKRVADANVFYSGNPSFTKCSTESQSHNLVEAYITIKNETGKKNKISIPCKYCKICGKRFVDNQTESFVRNSRIINAKIINGKRIKEKYISSVDIEKNIVTKKETANSRSESKKNLDVQQTPFLQRRLVNLVQENFLTRVSMNNCIINKHNIEHIRAVVDVIRPNGSVEKTIFPAFYCKTCKKYYILESEFKLVRKRGLLLCKIVDEKYWSSNKSYSDYLAQESLLHILGYNVNATIALSDNQRWTLLEKIVDNKIMTKEKIVAHLDMLCRFQENRLSMENAVNKWERDRHHILKYRASANRLVKVVKIKHRTKY